MLEFSSITLSFCGLVILCYLVLFFEVIKFWKTKKFYDQRDRIDELNVIIQNKCAYICVLENRLQK